MDKGLEKLDKIRKMIDYESPKEFEYLHKYFQQRADVARYLLHNEVSVEDRKKLEDNIEYFNGKIKYHLILD